MQGATTISQQLVMIDVLELKFVLVNYTKYVSYHFTVSELKNPEDIQEKPTFSYF